MFEDTNSFKINRPGRTSNKNKPGYFIANKKSSTSMAKRKNNMLSPINLNADEEILEAVFNSHRMTNDTIFTRKQYVDVMLRKFNFKCKNQRQKDFVKMIDENEITICIGESGVGKSYLSLAKALDLLRDSSNGYDKIFIITPLIESEGESIGYLKGDLDSKSAPYLYSIYYLIDKLIGEEARKKLVESRTIEPLFLSYLRGVNISDAIMVADESQNITISGMKTLLTRISYNCKYIISGDLSQTDRFKNPNDSGLKFAYEHLKDVKSIGLMEFTKDDIVRNPIIGEILNRFQ